MIVQSTEFVCGKSLEKKFKGKKNSKKNLPKKIDIHYIHRLDNNTKCFITHQSFLFLSARILMSLSLEDQRITPF